MSAAKSDFQMSDGENQLKEVSQVKHRKWSWLALNLLYLVLWLVINTRFILSINSRNQMQN